MKVYRSNCRRSTSRKSSPAARSAAKSCERPSKLRSDFPLIGASSELGKKNCQSNQGALVTMGDAFVEPTAAIIYFWGAKVTQLWMGGVEPLKPESMTDPDPI